MSSTRPVHLDVIVADVRAATRAAVARARRRRRQARVAAVALATVALGAGVAAAAGVDYVDLVKRVYPGAEVTDLSERQRRVVASLPVGRADVVVTDLGVTDETRTAPPGASVCDWNESSETLGCSSAAGSAHAAPIEIPAGTRVYRLSPGPTATAPLERSVLYVPELRLQLVVEPSGDTP
jgi:hypothetical protein